MVEIGEGLCGIGLGIHKRRQQDPVGVGGPDDPDDPDGAGCRVHRAGFEGEEGILTGALKDPVHLGVGLTADAEDGVQTVIDRVRKQGA